MGLVKAVGQNFARWLMEMPSNQMTPTIFAQHATDRSSELECDLIKVEAYDESWARKQGMNAFLAVAQGSQEPPVFLELTYNNAPGQEKPIVLVGNPFSYRETC